MCRKYGDCAHGARVPLISTLRGALIVTNRQPLLNQPFVYSAVKASITAKLFLAVLAACVTVLVVQAVATRIAFQRGFLDYLNEQSSERMREVLPRLAAAYRGHGDWEFLRNRIDPWFELLVPDAQVNDEHLYDSAADLTGALNRMGLLDAQLRLVNGNPRVGVESIRLPVNVDGAVVGWLAMVPFQQAIRSGDVRFMEQQRQALWLIGIGCVGVVALLTFLFTRGLMRRLRGLTQATHALAAGNYGSRIDIGTLDEIGMLARDFNGMAQALEHNERARRNFMADVSHELRTPLAVIRAEIEAVQDGIHPADATSLAAMHQEVGQLGKLIDDLHDLSLTDVGALAYKRSPIDLVTVLRIALSGMRSRFDAAGLRLEVRLTSEPLTLNGDERRLQQLCTNLLENSLRYTDAGGLVRITAQRSGATASVIIEDSAPGVAHDKLDHLFERFYRVEGSRNRASGGSGLGLAICRNIVEAHGGRIHASPAQLGGLRIGIELTLDTP